MKTLIIPMAGQSSRFPNLKPKWMLTHPKYGNFMVIESIRGLNLSIFDKIYFVCLKEHEDKYNFSEGLLDQCHQLNIFEKSEILYLNDRTNSQSETVASVIIQKNIEGFIFIKDSDNYFETNIEENKNQVCYFDLNDAENINAKNKSYIVLENKNYITNIVEKKVISSTFSVGGYGFQNASEFLHHYKQIHHMSGECYISNVIFQMIINDVSFTGTKTSNFKDWGTAKEWNGYKKTYKTFFVDLDGTLVTNTSHQMPPFIGMGQPLTENIKFLQTEYLTGRTKIIITTSRPESYRQKTEEELKKFNIPCDHLIMGLPHCQRILINDFAASNPYPSCSSINITRNSNNLSEYFL